MQVIEPGGPIGTQSRFKRREKVFLNSRKFVKSIWEVGWIGKEVWNLFDSVYTSVRQMFAVGIGVNRAKMEFTQLSGKRLCISLMQNAYRAVIWSVEWMDSFGEV